MEKFPSVIPVKLVLAFTRCSASTHKHERWERESIISVIPDIFNRESILAFFGWIPATNCGYDARDSFNVGRYLNCL
jgi:hypothetical protein